MIERARHHQAVEVVSRDTATPANGNVGVVVVHHHHHDTQRHSTPELRMLTLVAVTLGVFVVLSLFALASGNDNGGAVLLVGIVLGALGGVGLLLWLASRDFDVPSPGCADKFKARR